LSFYKRCLIALRAIDAFMRTPADDRKVIGMIKRLSRIVSKVSSEVPFCQTVKRLSRRADLFDELREKLRLAKSLPKNESEEDLNAMREQFEAWTQLGLKIVAPKEDRVRISGMPSILSLNMLTRMVIIFGDMR
jgi:hypothetical protein